MLVSECLFTTGSRNRCLLWIELEESDYRRIDLHCCRRAAQPFCNGLYKEHMKEKRDKREGSRLDD